MKSYCLCLFFLASGLFSYSQEKINWINWDQMIQERENDSIKKKVFIDLFTSWCGWCKRMDGTTFSDRTIVNYMNSKYYCVKFDAETKDTIVFNGHQFINSDPSFVKSTNSSRGKSHWFAHSILDGKLSYPSYVILDENLTRLMIYKGFKDTEKLLGILLFFASDQYKYYNNYLNEAWNKSLKNNSQN
ncbi:MAG: thioredoxin [Crocinitomicaceae bacterium]|nr:thioredoxin [Crocinitomicaceae bacterium]